LIVVESIIGNINQDEKLMEKYEEMSIKKFCETIKVSRLESRRVRIRKSSDKGTDIALTLQHGTQIKNGDVIILKENKMVIVEIEPEKVIMIEISDNIHGDDAIEIPVKVGHTIGNLHRPIKLERGKIYFPMQADTELEMFKRLLSRINEHVDIKTTRMVFEPEEGIEVHEH
jgi:urease accessory protein